MTNNKNIVFYILLLLTTVMTTSCIKYYTLIKTETPQGIDLENQALITAKYLRTMPVYDHFETRAIFDVLWMSYECRKAYVDLYAKKHGLSQDMHKEMFKQQLEENNHWITMYILADIRETQNPSLSDPQAEWNLQITIDNNPTLFVPESIKEVDLEPEIRILFGGRYNTLKTAYKVKFLIPQECADSINENKMKKLSLSIYSVNKKITLEWIQKLINLQTKAYNNEDFYWG